MSTALGRINQLLPQLDSEELQQLSGRIKSLASLGSDGGRRVALNDDETPPNDDEMFVLSAIADTMARLGADNSTAPMLRNSRDIGAFRRKLPSLLRYLQGVETRQSRFALLQLAVRLLHDEISGMERTVTSRTIMAHIHRIPAAVNRHFPGYASAGMLGALIRFR